MKDLNKYVENYLSDLSKSIVDINKKNYLYEFSSYIKKSEAKIIFLYVETVVQQQLQIIMSAII